MTTTIFLPDSEMYPHRYIDTDNTDIEFLPLDELDKFVGEYYFFINQGIDTTIDKLFYMEYISTMNGNVQPSDSVNIKKHIKKVFPERIIKDVQSGKCKYIMDQSLEGHWDINWEFIFDTLSITKEQLVWLSGDFKIHEKTNNIAMYINWWEKNCCEQIPLVSDITQTQLKLIESNTERAKYNTLYSRRVRRHRITFMTAMVYHNLLDNMIWSWGGDVPYGPSNMPARVALQDKVVNQKATHMHDMGKKYSEAYEITCDIVPLAFELSRLYLDRGKVRKANRVIEKSWKLNPHPDLFKLFKSIHRSYFLAYLVRLHILTILLLKDRKLLMIPMLVNHHHSLHFF